MTKYDIVLKIISADSLTYHMIFITNAAPQKAQELVSQFKPLFVNRPIIGTFIEGPSIFIRIPGQERPYEIEVLEFLNLITGFDDLDTINPKEYKPYSTEHLLNARNLLGGKIEDVYIDKLVYLQNEIKPL